MGNFCNCFPKDDAADINIEKKKLLKKKEIYTQNFGNLDLHSQVKETEDEDGEAGKPITQENKKKKEEEFEEKDETTEQNKENVISADFLNNTVDFVFLVPHVLHSFFFPGIFILALFVFLFLSDFGRGSWCWS